MKFRILLFMALALIARAGFSQASNYTKITNSGELFSTPNLSKNPRTVDFLKDKYGKDGWQMIEKYSEEINWPVGIKTLENRNKNRQQIAEYHAYFMCKLPDGSSLLWLPAAENQHMPDGMRSNSDIFFNIGSSGINPGSTRKPSFGKSKPNSISRLDALTQKNENNGASPTQSKPEAAVQVQLGGKRFEDQLPHVVADYANNFEKIKGEQKPDEGLFKSHDFQSRITLEGSKESYLAPVMFSSKLSFIADYGTYGSKAEAKRNFDAVVSKIDGCRFPCCTLVKNDPSSHSNLYTQAWLPFDLNSKMGPAYDGLLLEVQMIKTVDIMGEFKGSNDVWSLVLRVRKL